MNFITQLQANLDVQKRHSDGKLLLWRPSESWLLGLQCLKKRWSSGHM